MINHTQRRVLAGDAGGFDLWTAEAAAPGPHVVVLGGIHGDETQGVLAAGRLAADETRLTRGRVSIVPISHEAAYNADSRTSAIDGGNLARVFPGDPSGGPTEQIAHHIFTEVLDGADLLIDLHTSGQGYDMPFLAGYQADTVTADSLAKQAASTFGAEFLWRHPDRSEGRSVSVVDQAIYVECPGGGSMSLASVDAYVAGVQRVLAMMDMVASAPPDPASAAIRVVGGGNLDRDMISVHHAGLFLTDLVSGAKVEAGQLLGTVVATSGQVLEEVLSPSEAWVMAVKRRPPVSPDDLVVCLAITEE
jgi:predicted deacylase